RPYRHPLSFPTRRSSDLVQGDTGCYALNCRDKWFGHVTDRKDQAMVLRQVFAHFERLAASMCRTKLSEVLTRPKCSPGTGEHDADRMSTRLNSSHQINSY